MNTILILLLVLLLIGGVGSFPSWPHAAGWGYGPFGIIVTILVIVLVLKLLGVV